jgi:hypothetical protein
VLTSAVTSLNGLNSGVSLVEGDNVSINTNNNNGEITISAASPDGGLSSVASNNTLTGDGTSNNPLGIANNGVGAQQLANNAVDEGAIQDGAVTSAKIQNGTVTGDDISNGSIGTADLANNAAVTSLNGLASGVSLTGGDNVTVNTNNNNGEITISAAAPDGGLSSVNTNSTLSGDGTSNSPLGIANDAVDTPQLVNGAVAGNKLSANSVTSAKIQDGEVDTDDLANGAVNTAQLANQAVSGAKIADGALVGVGDIDVSRNNGALEIEFTGSTGGSGDITGVNAGTGLTGGGNSGDVTLGIANGGVNTQQLAGNAVTGAKIADGALVGIGDIDVSRNNGALEIEFTGTTSGAVTSVEGVNGLATVNGPTGSVELGIAQNGVNAQRLADNAVDEGAIQDDAVTNAKIDDGAVNTAQLVNQAVTGIKIADGALVGDGSNIIVNRNSNDALEISLTGSTGGAVTSVSGGTGIDDGGQTTGDVELSIADGGVGTQQLASGAVDEGAIQNGAVTSAKIQDDTVVPGDLDGSGGTNGQALITDGINVNWGNPSASVTTDGSTITGDGAGMALSVAPSGVTNNELASDAVTSANILNETIATADIDNGAVTAAKLASDAAIQTISIDDDNSSVTSTGTVSFNGTNGIAISASGNTITFDGVAASSIRWKENVRTLSDPVALVERLRGVRYDWKEDGTADVGVIAEEVAAVLPEVVAFEADGQARGVNYGKLVSVLIEATKTQQQSLESKEQTIQAQGAVIEKQQTEIEALKERMNRLERLMEQAAGASSKRAALDTSTNDR